MVSLPLLDRELDIFVTNEGGANYLFANQGDGTYEEVGQAYGLEGNHLEWANVPEKELAQRIEAKMPEVMKTLPPEAMPQDGTNDFFGEADALGGMDQAFQVAGAGGGLAPGDFDGIAGVPKSSMGWIIPVALGGSVLVIGLVVVLILFL